jgi:hypothetical protein
MSSFLEIVRQYPLLSLCFILGPFIGGAVGAYMGFDNLNSRLARERQQRRIELRQNEIKQDVGKLSIPIEALRRYERQLSAQGENIDVLKLVISQYDQLQSAITNFERFAAAPQAQERIAAADHIIAELRTLLGGTKTVPGPGGQALIIRTAQNTYRVTFAVPMRIPPNITFMNLPPGTEGHVVEKTNLGFTVIFTPTTVPVETFGFAASAEL